MNHAASAEKKRKACSKVRSESRASWEKQEKTKVSFLRTQNGVGELESSPSSLAMPFLMGDANETVGSSVTCG